MPLKMQQNAHASRFSFWRGTGLFYNDINTEGRLLSKHRRLWGIWDRPWDTMIEGQSESSDWHLEQIGRKGTATALVFRVSRAPWSWWEPCSFSLCGCVCVCKHVHACMRACVSLCVSVHVCVCMRVCAQHVERLCRPEPYLQICSLYKCLTLL